MESGVASQETAVLSHHPRLQPAGTPMSKLERKLVGDFLKEDAICRKREFYADSPPCRTVHIGSVAEILTQAIVGGGVWSPDPDFQMHFFNCHQIFIKWPFWLN